MLAAQIALGIWGGGLLLVGTVYAGGFIKEVVMRQKYSGVEWYRWSAR